MDAYTGEIINFVISDTIVNGSGLQRILLMLVNFGGLILIGILSTRLLYNEIPETENIE